MDVCVRKPRRGRWPKQRWFPCSRGVVAVLLLAARVAATMPAPCGGPASRPSRLTGRTAI
ncbi:hypothetical protein [Lysobacter gummosus]|uniref:hypothetical protein n=1 Tax=Lysobacter gummosus TaxID=262324 RepID=UPI003642610B